MDFLFSGSECRIHFRHGWSGTHDRRQNTDLRPQQRLLQLPGFGIEFNDDC
jgi:hypothetical protein